MDVDKDETSKTNTFVIGTGPALEAANQKVTWFCEWHHERRQYKRIPTVLEVDEKRKTGGSIPVSPQEFALIPNTVELKLRIPLELVEATKDRPSLSQPQTQQALGGSQYAEMIGFIGQAFHVLQEVRASLQPNVGGGGRPDH